MGADQSGNIRQHILTLHTVDTVQFVDGDNLFAVVLDHQVGQFELNLCFHALARLDLAGSELFDTTDLDDSQALVGIAKALIDRLLRHTESQIDLTFRGQDVDEARIHEVERNLLLDALKLADIRGGDFAEDARAGNVDGFRGDLRQSDLRGRADGFHTVNVDVEAVDDFRGQVSIQCHNSYPPFLFNRPARQRSRWGRTPPALRCPPPG